jgi:hypothetical protein
MNGGCTHLDRIREAIPSSWGCEGCLAQSAPPAPSHPRGIGPH